MKSVGAEKTQIYLKERVVLDVKATRQGRLMPHLEQEEFLVDTLAALAEKQANHPEPIASSN